MRIIAMGTNNEKRVFHVTFLNGQKLMHMPYDLIETMLVQMSYMQRDPEFERGYAALAQAAVERHQAKVAAEQQAAEQAQPQADAPPADAPAQDAPPAA